MKNSKSEARIVFNQILDAMSDDNGCDFNATEADLKMAEPAIKQMVDAGFFKDDPNNLDHSFWQIAAGEESEREEFFKAAPKSAYEVLSKCLERIFNRA